MRKFASVASMLLLIVAFAATTVTPASALPVPSKSTDEQTLFDREADLAQLQEIVAVDEVSSVLAAYGFSQDEVNQRLAQLSPDELHQLNGQVDQLHAAGQVPQYIWILIAVLIAVVIIASV